MIHLAPKFTIVQKLNYIIARLIAVVAAMEKELKTQKKKKFEEEVEEEEEDDYEEEDDDQVEEGEEGEEEDELEAEVDALARLKGVKKERTPVLDEVFHFFV